MNQQSKVLIQILLINLLSLFLVFNQAYSKELNCNSFKNESVQLENKNYPKSIEVIIPNTKKWMSRVLKATIGIRIDKRLKKYQKVKLIVTYSDNLKCEYWGKVRIHGSTKSHINTINMNASLRVILEDGHINNKYNFALLNKKSVLFEDEIFVNTLFNELGYLSPLNYITKVSINNNVTENYLFLEMPTLEMGKDKKKNNGIFLISNKNNFINPKTSNKYKKSIILNRVKNSEGIAANNNKTILYALDKLNYLYLNSLGIGNGRSCCDKLISNSNNKIIENYNSGIYALNFSILEDSIEIEKNSIFNLLMNATNSMHGLSLEDRSFYYDPTFDKFEPIYRDGDPRIVDQNLFNKKEVMLFEHEKEFVNKTVNIIKNINLDNLQRNIKARGLKLEQFEIKLILDKIVLNLLTIKEMKLFQNYERKLVKNYFANHFDKNLKMNLAFGGINNEFEVCDIELQYCKKIILEDEQKNILLKDKFLDLDEFSEPVTYIRLSKESYLNNSKPLKRGLKNFSFIEVNKNLTIFHNTEKKNIIINRSNKEIILNQKEIFDKFVFIGQSFHDWKIKFFGSINYIKDYPLFKRDENMIGGCVAFINSEFKNIEVEVESNTCSKGVEVLNSNGSFKRITINNSKSDGFDSEFSNLFIEKIVINGAAGGECIGLKRGKYLIKNADVNNCGAHSVSVGEHAELTLNKIVANNSRRIMSKDSSKITIFNFTNKNSNECFLILRKKKQYDGALIKMNKKNLKCDNKRINKDKYSKIEFF